MSDLTAAMGINSPSLYACFGSKEGLFRAVLERYDERRKSFMESVLAAPTGLDIRGEYVTGQDEGSLELSAGTEAADKAEEVKNAVLRATLITE